jgi:intein/homing endonuclease
VPRKVLYVGKYEVYKDLVNIELDENRVIHTTVEHPFLTTDGWKSLNPDHAYTEIILEDPTCPGVTLLQVGDYLLCEDGLAKVTDITEAHLPNLRVKHYVYNLDIEECDTFIADGVVVHNINVDFNKQITKP